MNRSKPTQPTFGRIELSAIKLPAVCDTLASDTLKTEMSDVCGVATVEIDAAEVEKIGQACLQLLVAASRSSGGIAIKNPSEAFAASADLAGLASVLALESE